MERELQYDGYKIMWQDVRFALRVLRTSPGLTAVTVFTLALGIAANTTVFSWVDGLLLHPFPGSSDSDRLAVLETITQAPNGGTQVSYRDYLDYRGQLTSVAGLALHREEVFTLGESTNAQPVWGELVTGNYFSVLGLRPEIGRVFTREEDNDNLGAYPVAVISHSLWVQRFHSDPKVIGKTIRVNRCELFLVGVAPVEFRGTMPGIAMDIWVPVTMAPQLGMAGGSILVSRGYRAMYGVVRLKPRVAYEQAAAEAASVAAQLAAESPTTNLGLSATILPPWRFHSAAPDLLFQPLRILMCLAVLVLAIVCANVANLLLTRSLSRKREYAIRLALGAGRLGLIRLVLIETGVLSAAGVFTGLLFSFWMADSLAWLMPHIGLRMDSALRLNGRILLFTILTCAVATLLVGLAPALFCAHSNVREALKEGGRSGSVSAGSRRLRGLLVVSEVALACVALIVAGLFARSFQNALSISPGFDKNNILLGRFFLSGPGYSPANGKRFCIKLRGRLLTAPGVTGASFANFAPLGAPGGPWDHITVDGYLPASGEAMTVNSAMISPGYLKVLGIPLLEGRDIIERDDEKNPQVILVSEAFARRYFGNANPIGRIVRCEGVKTTVVGLVKDSKYFSVTESPRPFIYTAFRQRFFDTQLLFFVKTSGDPMQAIGTLRREAVDTDPNAGSFYPFPMTEWIGITMLPQKIAASMMTGLGLIALVLAAIGLYSVMAYAVSQRTQEIGVRMALGARPGDVFRDVLRKGMLLTSIGLLAGIAGALAITRLISGTLVNVSASDPTAFAGAVAFLIAVAALANYVPARRATKVDPIIALRFD